MLQSCLLDKQTSVGTLTVHATVSPQAEAITCSLTLCPPVFLLMDSYVTKNAADPGILPTAVALVE